MNSKQLGDWGEKIAENYLKSKRYRILERNYFTKFIVGPKRGEIDIIAKKEDVISFVEVKTLKSDKIISPEEKVDYQKQRKLIKMANFWLMENKIPLDRKWQIDVIAIEIREDNKVNLRHFQNAVF